MKAVRNAPPTVEVVDVDEPDGSGELIRVASTGICASDLMYLRWGSTQIAGHEIAGVRDEGTPVAVEAIFGCGECDFCAQGAYNNCVQGTVGLGFTEPGGMSEWFRAPSHCLVPLPVGLSAADAALVEPGSVALHACHVAGVGPDTSVAIVGAGAIGILAAAAAQLLGAPLVAVEARHPHQHAARERIGARAASGVAQYDVVIETGGSESALHRAVELARTGGKVVYLGVYEPDTTWPHFDAFIREISLVPSLGYCGHHGRREFAQTADLLVARPELVDTLITHRYPIEDAAEAFRVASDKSLGVFRVVVQP
jgi:2-desacetyl-2-hydroxyethyl bacteriochlorophyllide A dehydrogenase